jgi:oligoribonuclease
VTDILLWLDLETTGTDEAKDSIIEIAVIPTTPDLDQVGEWTATDEGLGRLLRTPVVRAMHEANGLLAELLEEGDRHHTIGAVDHQLDTWLVDQGDYLGVNSWILAGSGVGHFDRRFIKAQMPKLDRRLRHWCIDVGVVRRAYSMWTDTAEVHPGHVPGKTHRALDDVRFHLEEARMWRRMWREAEQIVGQHA